MPGGHERFKNTTGCHTSALGELFISRPAKKCKGEFEKGGSLPVWFGFTFISANQTPVQIQLRPPVNGGPGFLRIPAKSTALLEGTAEPGRLDGAGRVNVSAGARLPRGWASVENHPSCHTSSVRLAFPRKASDIWFSTSTIRMFPRKQRRVRQVIQPPVLAKHGPGYIAVDDADKKSFTPSRSRFAHKTTTSTKSDRVLPNGG
jgi:hypothetical protein